MKINFENRDYESQVIKNTKDIEDLKEKYKGEVYAALPYSEWPEDVVLEQVEDPREFTYVPRAITNVPADAKYGYFLMNVEDFEDPSNSAALLFKIKSVNNSTVYIEFYANVASHVPGPQGETGATGQTGAQGPQGPAGISIYYANTALSTTSGNSTTVAVTTITNYGGTLVLNINDLIVGSNGYLGAISAIDLPNLTVKTMTSLVGPQGQATIGIQVVAELPASGTEGVIYLVPAEDPETGNAYDEYIYTNSAWEKFGYVDIDLTDYALKSEIPVIDEDLIPKAFNTYVLGDNTHSYKEVVANKFKSPNSYYEISGVNINGHGQVSIKTTDGNGTSEAQIQLGNTALYTNKNIAPMSGSTINLGQASNGFNNLYLDGKIVTDDNLTYGLALPDTTSFTADKTLATTDQIPTLPTYSISNVVTDQSDVLGIQVTDGNVTANINNTTANPTLAGTESTLTSIEIGGTKYAMSSSDLSLMPDEVGWSQSLSESYWINGIDKTNNGYLYTPWRVASNFTYNPFSVANSIGLKNPYTDGVCLDKLMTDYLYAKNPNGGYYNTKTENILGYWIDNVRGNNAGDVSLYENYTKNILNASNNVSLVLWQNSSTFTSSGSDRLYSYDFSQDYTYLDMMPTYYGYIGIEGPICQLRPQKAYISVRGHLFNLNKQFVKLLEIPLDFIDEIDPCNATKLAEYQANDGVGTQTLIKTFKLFDETLTINVYSRVPSSLNPVVDIYIGRTNNGSSTTQNIKNVDSINISIFTKTEFVASYN